jgi:sn-glycerol 3-phosphate transport system substrate-binding protein
VEAAARKLRASGVPCGFTTAWPSWVHVENLSAFHNVPLATKANGFGGLDAELLINNDLVVRHIATLAEWQKTKIFDYGGRADRADAKFTGSQCGIYISSSATRADILANAKFEVGFGMMPYWPDVPGAPQNSIIGGATLWVLKGRPEAEYKGVARFFAYLSKPGAQAWWHQATGYLPITNAAYRLSIAQGFYDRNPGADISIKQITLHPPTENSKGLRLGSFVLIRDLIEDEMEQALAGKKPAKAAMDSAARRGNDILRRFEKANP